MGRENKYGRHRTERLPYNSYKENVIRKHRIGIYNPLA